MVSSQASLRASRRSMYSPRDLYSYPPSINSEIGWHLSHHLSCQVCVLHGENTALEPGEDGVLPRLTTGAKCISYPKSPLARPSVTLRQVARWCSHRLIVGGTFAKDVFDDEASRQHVSQLPSSTAWSHGNRAIKQPNCRLQTDPE